MDVQRDRVRLILGLARPFLGAVVVAVATTLDACAGGSSGAPAQPIPTPTPSPVPSLAASPSSVLFGGPAAFPSPQQVSVTSTVPFGTAPTVTVSDPAAFGASAPVISGATATFTVYPISHGSTAAATITVSGSGASATVPVSTWVCGRPDNLTPSSQLIFPRPGSTGNATTNTTLYFMVTSQVAPATVKLHLIVGTNGTLEGDTLVVAAPPPGAATLAPPSTGVVTYMSGTVPALRPGTAYATQIYDDTCQLPVLTGSFST